MSFNAADVLPGAWVGVTVVTDMHGTETESFVGYVTDEKTISKEYDEADWAFPEAKNRVRKRLHSATDLEFQVAVVRDLTNLQTLEIIDTSGTMPTLTKGTVSIRLDVFEEKPDDYAAATADLVIDMPTVEVAPDEIGLPQDGSSVSFTGYVNGDIYFPEIVTA